MANPSSSSIIARGSVHVTSCFSCSAINHAAPCCVRDHGMREKRGGHREDEIPPERCGYLCDDDVSTADVIVVNTCSFIQDATEESLEMIFDMADLDCVASGNTKIVVAGCMPARYGSDLEEELTEASSFVPCARECDIVEVVDECLRLDRLALPDAGSIANRSRRQMARSWTFAYVKISDGCADRWCSYCTIPLIRGRYHKLPYDEHTRRCVLPCSAWREGDRPYRSGYRALGDDFDDPSSLAELLCRLAEEFPETWFRVMYLQPKV